MKSIANQYRDLKEGKMTQANFMRNLRMSMPQFVTNVTSFNDAVRILKNKSILTESHIGNDQWYEDFQNAISAMGLAGEAEARVMKALNHTDPLTQYGNMPAAQAAAEFVDDLGIADDYDDYEPDTDADYEEPRDDFDMAGDFNDGEFWEGKESDKDEMGDDELDAILKGIEAEKAGEEAVMSQYDEELNEGKKKEEKEYHRHQCNPTELRLGIRTELEHGDMELDKAKEIAYKNIAKDPIYYTKLKLSGLEAHPKKVKGEKEIPAKKAKKEATELVDKANQMQKVKMPKKDEKKKLKENVDEKMRFQDLPADPEVYKTVKDMKDKIMKATNADGIEFQRGDVVKAFDGEEIKITDFKEEQGKIKALYNKGMFFATIDIDGLEAPKPTMRPGVNIGASFEKMKRSMEEIVREAISEYFDGRDNLINPLSAEEENK
jgi:hypothetical protein